MTPADFSASVVLGIVEGMTEFIPVSSTGHLIVAGSWLGFTGDRAKTFEIFIQFGAILAIVWLYRHRFLDILRRLDTDPASRRFVLNLVVAFIPAAVLGVFTHRWILDHLFTPTVVALGFILGGIAILIIERWKPAERVTDADAIPVRVALGVGLAQMLALWPGVSRSGATIMGGYALGLSRTAATEFSFFLAVPVITAAAGFDLVKNLSALAVSDIPVFAVGSVVSFLAAFLVVKAFLKYVGHHSFSVFAWYRIVFGIFLLWLYARTGFPPL